MSFSQKAKDLREYSGLSQKSLSEKIGISAAAIGFLELNENEPKGATVAAYAKYFGVSADYLLDLEDDFIKPTALISEASNYSLEEKNLVENYRELNKSGKRLIRETIDTLRKTAVQSGQKKHLK